MMKKNKLYTVNKFNRPMFMPEENIFDGFHPVGSQMTFGSGISPDVLGGYKTTFPGVSPRIDFTDSQQSAAVYGTTAGLANGFSGIADSINPFKASSNGNMLLDSSALSLANQVAGNSFYDVNSKNWLGISKKDNPFSKVNLKNAFSKQGLGNAVKGIGSGLISAGAGMLGNIAGNAISGGLSSTAGNAIGSLGSTIGGAVGMVNPLAGAAVTFASNLVGGTVNRAFGTKVDEAKRNQVNADIAKMNSFTSNAGSFDEIKGPESVSMDTDVYEGGWFSSGDADDKNEELKRKLMAAVSFANRSVDNNIYNLADDQLNNALANYSALGGSIETSDGMGALEYDVMSGLMNTKRKNVDNKNQMTNMFMGTPKTFFDFGGDLQTNFADFPTGLVHIDAGKSHEENPNDGVQMGVDQEGVPNLVEEGETVFNDYVFSNRILADEATKKLFHLPKKKDISFADISKKLEKEIAERPNDVISRAGFNAQMQTLEEQQERQKQEMEAERAKAAFEALTPEEQTALMQQKAQQEAMAQEAAMQQQAMAEQQAAQEQSTPEETVMMQQQADGTEANAGQAPVMADGGHLFDYGGALEWLKREHPEAGNKEQIARVLAKRAKKIGTMASTGQAHYDYKSAYNGMIGSNKPIGKENDALFESLVKDGMERKAAFGLAYPQNLGYPYNSDKYKSGHEAARNAAYKKYITDYKPAKKAEQAAQTVAAQQQVAQPQNQRNYGEVFTKANAALSAMKDAALKAQVAAPEVQEAPAAKPQAARTGNRAASNNGDIVAHKYDWYRNGSDGSTTPTGFTVGKNGLIDKKTGYTDDYRKLVASRGAKDIKDWALAHVEDPSLQSFLAKNYNGSLDAFIADDKFTDDMWRQGATDGKYGFMHHVGSSMLKDNKPIADELGIDQDVLAQMENESRQKVDGMKEEINHTPQTYHAMDGDDYDGYIEGELDPNVVGAETRRETLPNGDVIIYHGRPGASTEQSATVTEDGKVVPIHKNEKLRYAGLFGPVVGLGMQMVGVGKPDYSGFDAAIANAGRVTPAGYKTIGDYLTYRPMDIWFEQNRMDANARATDRAILNSGVNQGSKMAGLLASGYNNQIADGELYRKALEYNDAKRQQVAEFNRGTNRYNADAYNRNQEFNASAYNHANQAQSNLMAQRAAHKLQGDAGWYNSLYGNVNQLFKGIADLGRENYQYNQMVDLLGSGAMPGVTEQKLIDAGYYRRAKEGGKIKRKKGKKGLTY